MPIKSLINTHQIDADLAPFRSLFNVRVPSEGWARVIRDALGMTNVQLARRMHGKAPQSVDDLLRSESARTIKLSSMDELAKAMNCRVVYALVPERPINALREEQAIAVASEQLNRVFYSMELENQGIAPERQEEIIKDYAKELLHTRPRKLWD